MDLPQSVDAARTSPRQPGWRLQQILTTMNFWAVVVAIAAITAVNQAIVVTIVPYGTELGFSPGSVALLITAFSISAAIVKVGSGILAEYIDQRLIMLASALAMIASLLVLLTFSSYPALMIACCLAGTALGCILPSTAVLVASCFGSPSFGTVMGAVYVAIGISSIASVRFVGGVFDRNGNYREAFIIFVILSVVAALGSLMVRPPRSATSTPRAT
jgi:MFS family permease